MRQWSLIACLLMACAAWAQAPPETKAVLLPGLGDLHHPVSAGNAEAQQFFDQGMRLLYGFNHDEAERSFRRAAELDPQLAMAWWGVAYAVGPNYNLPVDAEREKIGYDAAQKALALSANAPENEKAYINALAKRYSNAPKPDYQQLSVAYSNAMRELWHHYPDDPDAGTLFAESMMDLRPWQLWNRDGTPAPGTEEIVSTLETVLRSHPDHMGALHFYIHAVEASPNPERALAAADRLAAMKLSGAGHLEHMPGHIYFLTGDYGATVKANLAAVADDENFEKVTGEAQGVYPLMYHAHNLHFLAIAAEMEGHCGEALAAARKLDDHVRPALPMMAMVQVPLSIPMEIDVRCERWEAAVRTPAPDPKYPVLVAIWHFSRGMALLAQNKPDEALAEEKALAEVIRKTPKDELLRHNNNMPDIFTIADDVLLARLAETRGDRAGAVNYLRAAVAIQDSLHYDEPPDWYFPVRESLGGVLLRSGEAKEAEQVFREDLQRNPRNPRSLFGLANALKKQGRDYDAGWVEKEFQSAWQGADLQLSVDKL